MKKKDKIIEVGRYEKDWKIKKKKKMTKKTQIKIERK